MVVKCLDFGMFAEAVSFHLSALLCLGILLPSAAVASLQTPGTTPGIVLVAARV